MAHFRADFSISYNPSSITVTGTIPFTISPTNTGGAVPAVVYGQVTTFAGSPTGVPGFVDGVGTQALFNNSQDMGSLDPVFVSTTNSYVDSVSNATTTINLTPTATAANSTITVNGQPVKSGSPSEQIPLAVGSNIITTVVTAQDGVTIATYTVNVIRAPSSNANLIGLTVSEGTLTPAFNSSITMYADTVSNATTSITATPTDSDTTATITVNGMITASGTASNDIPLAVGSNTITVVITAQDGVTTHTYTVIVYRGEPESAITSNNVLTPNGDGKNDVWVINDITLYPQNNVTVFDRGGRVVFHVSAYNNTWDGTLNGKPLAAGTYYYVVDLGPNQRKFKGFISIVRN